MLVICISPCAHYILHCYKIFESMQYCVLTEAAVRLPWWSISDTGTFNTGITFVLKRNIISRKLIKFSMSMHISTLCPYYYKILKKTELTKWLITIWKTTKYLYHEISCNIFFNAISFIPHSWYLNGFNKEHTSMLLVSTLFRRKTMCIFT